LGDDGTDGISGIKTAFSEKCSDSSFTRKVLQKPRNDATNATVKTVETGKTAVVTKLTLTKLVVKTGSCQNCQADKTDPEEEDGFIYTEEADRESLPRARAGRLARLHRAGDYMFDW